MDGKLQEHRRSCFPCCKNPKEPLKQLKSCSSLQGGCYGEKTTVPFGQQEGEVHQCLGKAGMQTLQARLAPGGLGTWDWRPHSLLLQSGKSRGLMGSQLQKQRQGP